ncbi:MAG: glycosyl transferase family 2 [Firmicutes bacterium]|nr:glycosyl transferase family 2 [Bacillota bacterium]
MPETTEAQREAASMTTACSKKIFSISMVKNEADIIESFVRYHAKIFDGLVILDNKSNDNTLAILKQLQQEGLPLFVLEDANGDYYQSKKMTKLLYDTMEKYSPDIVMPLDADEFLTSVGSINPREILQQLDAETIYHVKWRTYIQKASDSSGELFVPKRLEYAREDSHETFSKIIVNTAHVKKGHLALEVGSHNYKSPNITESYRKILHEGMRLAHFPVRSVAQLKTKILIGWINSLARHDRQIGQGFHRQYLFDKIVNNQEISAEMLETISKTYDMGHNQDADIKTVFKPIDLSWCQEIEIKYAELAQVDYLKSTLKNAAALASNFAKMRANVVTNLEFIRILAEALQQHGLQTEAQLCLKIISDFEGG